MLKDLTAEPITKVSENDNAKEHSQATDCASQTVKELTEAPVAPTPCAQFGMAFSLRKGNNLQEVTMLPVGVQVTLKDRKSRYDKQLLVCCGNYIFSFLFIKM